MPPTHLALILRPRVLGVMDEHPHPMQSVHHPLHKMRRGLARQMRRLSVVVNFIVTHIRHRPRTGFETEPSAASGMIGEEGDGLDGTDFKVIIDLVHIGMRGHVIHRYGKIGRLHLHRQNFRQVMTNGRVPENMQLICRNVGRHKERKALNMIPMRVADEKIHLQRLL